MPMTAVAPDIAVAFKQGIQFCRKNKWREGYDLLARVAPGVENRGNMPSVFYSYLGAAMARVEGRRRDGMELCRYALQLSPEEPENYLNIASVYLMLNRRQPALRAIEQGLALRPWHPRLLEMRASLGVRQPPVFPSMARTHPLNLAVGRVRHWMRKRRLEAQERKVEIEQFGE
jgi:tetratricopeptide (TPR) repeat protein